MSAYVSELCEINYGSAPAVTIRGQTDTCFQYIPIHLEYIACELLKNAFRATVEESRRLGRSTHPPIDITVSKEHDTVGIRIRDAGGGIAPEQVDMIWKYSYTTVKEEAEGLFTHQTQMAMQAGVGGPMGTSTSLTSW